MESATGVKGLVAQAERQLKAANGAPIEWHCQEKEVIKCLQEIFRSKGIDIRLIYAPLTK